MNTKSVAAADGAPAASAWAARTTSAAPLTSHAPLYVQQGKYVLLVARDCMNVYATATGALLRKLQCRAPISSACLDQDNAFRVAVATVANHVNVFDWTDGSCLHEYTKGGGGKVLHAAGFASQQIFLLCETGGGQCDLVEARMADEQQLVCTQRGVTRGGTPLGMVVLGDRIVVQLPRCLLTLRRGRRSGNWTLRAHELPSQHAVTAFACTRDLVACGDEEGRIVVYADAFAKTGPLRLERTLHWHARAVGALSFALGGAYLLSGGAEHVLVLWQLETSARQFLPRLGARITRISVQPDDMGYAVLMADATCKLIDATDLSLRAEICSMHPVKYDTPVCEAAGGTFFIGGTRVQMWDLEQERQSMMININRIHHVATSGREHVPVREPEVKHVCVNPAGTRMLTYDEWTPVGATSPSESHLKFWVRDASPEWQLVTRIDSPHGREHVVCDVVSDGNGFATIGTDGCVRCWQPRQQRRVSRDFYHVAWMLPHPRKQSHITRASLALSSDNSLLVCSVMRDISIVAYATGTVKQHVPHAVMGHTIRRVAVCGASVMMVTEREIVSWDVASARPRWTIDLPSTGASLGAWALAVDCTATYVAVSVNSKKDNYLAVFDPASPYALFHTTSSRSIAAVVACTVPGVSEQAFAVFYLHGDVQTVWCESESTKHMLVTSGKQIEQQQQPVATERPSALLASGKETPISKAEQAAHVSVDAIDNALTAAAHSDVDMTGMYFAFMSLYNDT